MANYYENARTNYFRVKDDEKFKEFISSFDGLTTYEDDENRHTILFDYESGVPFSKYNDETQDYDDVDFLGELSNHLADNSVAVLIGAGAEKLRYINGYAEAIDNTGERVSINLNAIYNRALEKFGSEKEITMAEY